MFVQGPAHIFGDSHLIERGFKAVGSVADCIHNCISRRFSVNPGLFLVFAGQLSRLSATLGGLTTRFVRVHTICLIHEIMLGSYCLSVCPGSDTRESQVHVFRLPRRTTTANAATDAPTTAPMTM